MTSTRRIAIAIAAAGVIGLGGGLAYWYQHPGKRFPTLRLASITARSSGEREPRRATIGDVTRYVMGTWDPVELTSTGSRRTEDGASVDVRCPAALRGRRVSIVVDRLSIAPDPGWHRVEALAAQRCPDADDTALAVPLPASLPDPLPALRVTAMPDVEPSTVSGWFDVPWRAELRLATGATVIGNPSRRSVPIALAAENRAGRREEIWRGQLALPSDRSDVPWTPQTVSLDWARWRLGPSMRLVFEATLVADDQGNVLPFWGSPTVWTRRQAPPAASRRNVVLISLDTLRADRLSSYGYPIQTTPILDRFAAEGTLFEQAIAPSNWTLPSHASMLTGLDPCAHQVGSSDGDRQVKPLPAGVRPLAEYLRDAGYATAAITEDGYVNPISFQRGFSVFRADTRHRPPPGVRMIDVTLDAALEWLEENADVPFFLFFHTYEVHEPYETPPGYEGLGKLNPLPLAPRGLPPSMEAAADAAAYVAEVAYTDHALDRLFTALERLKVKDRTIVVVTSDHGEAFGEHGVRRHGFSLNEEEIHVPLIWRAPGLIEPGRRVRQIVGLIDIVPTLLDLLGLQRTSWMSGVSLQPALQVGEWVPPSAYRTLAIEGLTSEPGMRGDGWKITYRIGRPELYDLLADPAEWVPRSGTAAKYDAVHVALQQNCLSARAHIADAAKTSPTPAATAVPTNQQEKLRALGYVE